MKDWTLSTAGRNEKLSIIHRIIEVKLPFPLRLIPTVLFRLFPISIGNLNQAQIRTNEDQ